MNKQQRTYVALGVIIIMIGGLIITYPRTRILFQEEYTPLEFYPTYYYENFTVASSDTNAALSFDINIDFAGNYTSFTIIYIIYQLLPEEFEDNFNLTEVRDNTMREDWDKTDIIWWGWHLGNINSPYWGTIHSGAYVFVFWVESNATTTDWSAKLTVHLKTSFLPVS